jgi:two-component system NtrC family sensor kinase
VAAGDYKLQVQPSATDEIGFLARSFNEMIESLDSSQTHLEAMIGHLNEMVAKKARELRAAQFQVVQAEKLSSVGLVAAGIAHELNSPLMAIITFAHMLQKESEPGSQEHKDLDMILRESERCANIIRNLLEFSREEKQELELEPCSLESLIDRSLELVMPEIRGRGIETKVDVSPGLPDIEADPGQLTQVFVNLMLNAVQAMSDGGRFTVQVGAAGRDEYPTARIPPGGEGGLIRALFRDTGHGIRPEDIGKVFDPFFTTKEAGKGTGLGLSVSHGIITRHGGTILVESDGRTGTEFTVLLPAKVPLDVS